MINTTTNINPNPVLTNKERLAKLESLLIMDSPAEEAFDRLTRLASKIIGSPVSLVSLVDDQRQFFKSAHGLDLEQTPLSHSFCQYVVATGQPLIVEDARKEPLLEGNLAITDLDVIGYLGMPISTSDGHNIGSFCVIDSQPRQWTAEQIEIVQELAISVMAEIELREQILAREEAEQELQTQNRRLRRVTLFCRATLEHMNKSLQHGAQADELKAYVAEANRELNSIVKATA